MSNMSENSNLNAACAAAATVNPAMHENIGAPKFTYDVQCIGPDGQEKWREVIENTVTTVGKTDIIDKYFKGSAYTAAFYLGLKGAGSVSAGDTLASHSGWTEVTPYSGNRPAITFGSTSAGSNTATAVSYTTNATYTVAGAFVATVNTGTSGTLYSAGDFAVARSGGSGDTINVTLTVSAS
ncbi:hypothetical protein BH10PLA2_BH10PLA2_00590 [soil metagenome]